MAGRDHTLALKPDGTIWAWGSNFNGQLGVGSAVESIELPVQIGTANDWSDISAGGDNSYAIKTDGTLWAWGSNQFGQIGDGLTGLGSNSRSPKKVGTATSWKNVSAGSTYTMAIKTDGSLWAWGTNLFGQLGFPGSAFVPTRVGAATDWKTVSTSVQHTVAIKNDGSLWGWGSNSYFQLGDESITGTTGPIKLGPSFTWKTIDAGFNFTMGITTDGKRWTCGFDEWGQLGNGVFSQEALSFTNFDPAVTWKDIAVGYNFVVGIKTDGTLWTWGFKIGTFEDKTNVPVQIGTAADWQSVSVGDYHAFAFKTDGSLWGWGAGDFGKLGTGSWQDFTEPQNVGGGTPVGNTYQLFCGSGTVADLEVTGSAVQWYSQPTGGSPLATNTALVNNGDFYAAQTLAGCESIVRLHVTVAVNPLPAAPTGVSAQTLCAGSSVSAIVAGGTGIKWYTAPTGGLPLTPETMLLNNTHYFASQTINGCESIARLDVNVTLNNTPPATGSSTQIVCLNSTIANLSASGSNIKWYSSPTGGSPLSAGTLLIDQQHYYATQTVSSYESCGRLDVKVTIAQNVAPNGQVEQIFCFAATVAALTVENGTGIKWYATSVGGSPLAASTTLVNGNHYFASQTIGPCETTQRLDVAVTVNLTPKPTGNDFQRHCLESTVAALRANGSNIKWYYQPEGAEPLNPAEQLFTETYYYASATNGTLESCERLQVYVIVEDIPAPYGNPVQTFCNTATPAQLIVAGNYEGEIKWYTTPVGGVPLASNTLLNDNTSYYASQTAEGCESTGRAEITVDLNTTPTPAPTGSASQVICGNNFQLTATGTDILWYTTPTGGEPMLGTDELADNTHYYATQTINTCESVDRLDVLITINNPPTQPQITDSEKWLSYSISEDYFVMAIKVDGSLWGWGKNFNQQLGIVSVEQPYQPTLLTQMTGWKTVSAGKEFSLALKNDGTLWRLNVGGTWQQVGAESDWASISTGSKHAILLKTNGTLWGIGKNLDGQVGDGTQVTRILPVQIGSDTWTNIAAGSDFSLARKADGTIWAWGNNSSGQLGDGTNTARLSAVKIGTATDWKSVFANGVTSYAIKNNGTLWGWGYLHYGSAQTTSPQQFGSATDWLAVSTGGEHTLGLKSNGTLWSWGSNNLGERGVGTYSDIPNNTPQQVGSDTDWTTSDAGPRQHISLKTDGTLWSWGDNYYKQNGIRNGNVTHPNPQYIASSGLVQLCSAATLADLPVTGTSIKWYNKDQEYFSQLLPASTPVVNGGMYFATQTVNGCESALRKGVVVLLGTTNSPTGPSSQTLCYTSTVNDLSVMGSGIVWYDVPVGGSPLAASTPLISGNHYYAAQKIGICESGRLNVTVTLTQPAAPTGSAVQTLCSGSTILNLQATGSSVSWYSAPTGGSPITGSTLLSNGVHYYASQTINGCESPVRLDVVVGLNTTAAPTGSASQTLCSGSKVSALSAGGSAIKWYASSTSQNALASTVTLTNGSHYYASQTVGGCESTSRLDVIVTLTTAATPTGSNAQTFCAGATVGQLAANGSGIKWYSSITGTSPIADATVLVNGASYYATQTVNGCESLSRFMVSVTVLTVTPPAASATQTFCLTGTVGALEATGTALKWYSTSTGGTPLTELTPLTSNTNYFVSQTSNGCESARTGVMAIVTNVDAPSGESSQSFSANATLADLEATGTSLRWYGSVADAIAGSNELTPSTPLTTGLTYYGTQTIDGCEGDDVLAVTVNLITGIEKNEYGLHIYPNPVKDDFRISANEVIDRLIAWNEVGQAVHSQNIGARDAEVDFSGMAKGIYSVQVHINGRVFTVRILKQ